MAYITGMMTKLSPGELISFQIILSPTHIKEIDKISRMIRRDPVGVLDYLEKRQAPLILSLIGALLKLTGKIISAIFYELAKVLQEAQSDPEGVRRLRQHDMFYNERVNTPKPLREASPFEQEMINSIQEKINQPLFNGVIRLLVIAKNQEELNDRITGFNSSLATFTSSSDQFLKTKESILNLI